MDSEIFLVDSDEGRCREAKERFRGIRVLCGDMSDKDFIRDEGLDACDLKWWYSFAMIAGRLEIFTMLILVGRVIALLATPSGLKKRHLANMHNML